MAYDILVMMMAGWAISFVSEAQSAPCPATTVSVNVTSIADVQDLSDALTCTGESMFNVTWYPSMTLAQTINVANRKEVSVTGVGHPIIRGALADGNDYDIFADAGDGNGTGIFSVSNGSTLRLNHLVLDGGNAEHGGAVGLFSSSTLFVSSCTFANNNASKGGERTGLPTDLLCKYPGLSPNQVYNTPGVLKELNAGP